MPKYDPHKHQRRSIRWKGWDYGAPAYYFITICTHQRAYLFENKQFFKIATHEWQCLPNHPKSQHIDLDEAVVMPNHKHGIIAIRERLQDNEPVQLSDNGTFRNVESGKLGRLVATYKSLVTRRINTIRGTQGTAVWQRGYWDRVIRNERELNAIRKYIQDNLKRWAEDRENLDNLVSKMNYHP